MSASNITCQLICPSPNNRVVYYDIDESRAGRRRNLQKSIFCCKFDMIEFARSFGFRRDCRATKPSRHYIGNNQRSAPFQPLQLTPWRLGSRPQFGEGTNCNDPLKSFCQRKIFLLRFLHHILRSPGRAELAIQ